MSYSDSCSSPCSHSSWCSSSELPAAPTCSIVIFSVGWAEHVQRQRSGFKLCSFLAYCSLPDSFTIVCCQFQHHLSFSIVQLSRWLKMSHPRKGVEWCCLRNYRILRLLVSVVVRRPLTVQLFLCSHTRCWRDSVHTVVKLETAL